eukprot:Unigene9797_Nuclearia_a/m.29916 Unigene9797_Nuclearia_a/g.29916  ORF Unigene9797_Nuclearia_a/g.29916 Unigene9797_Nuclearia_a/m.29916 type:complete len:299 (-) Unigene9797_Nuclearia_a:91-987(-)
MLERDWPTRGMSELRVGVNGLPKVRLVHPSGRAAVEAYLHGASVTSWTVDGVEQLFVSAEAVFNGKNPIRGGIPIVFPQFAMTGPLRMHGFARNQTWRVEDGPGSGDGQHAVLQFRLADDDETRAEWDGNAFELTYTVTLGERTLATQLHVRNRNADRPFTFTTALHTYFAAGDIECVRVHGFKGRQYTNNPARDHEYTEESDAIVFAAETDRVYYGMAGAEVSATDGEQRHIALRNEGFEDMVVWNPWINKSKAMPDFGDDEYHRMFCIEVATIQHPVTLAPGAAWSAGQLLTAGQQ